MARNIASSIAESPPPTMSVGASLEERRVAGGAVADAAAGELLLARDAELAVLGAHRQDDGPGQVQLIADPDLVRAAVGGELERRHVVGLQAARRSARPGHGSAASGPGPMIPSGSPG